MAIKRPTKQTAKEKDRARSSDKVVHVPEDQIIGVSDSDQSINPEPRESRSTASGAIVARASSEEWQFTSSPPSSPEAKSKRNMLRKMKHVPMKETRMTTGKNRGSTYEMIVLNDPEYCKTLMQTQRKVNDEVKMKEWLQDQCRISGTQTKRSLGRPKAGTDPTTQRPKTLGNTCRKLDYW